MTPLLNWFAQMIAVTALNLRTLRQRLASSAVAVVGIAGVVAVVVAATVVVSMVVAVVVAATVVSVVVAALVKTGAL